MAGRKQSDIKGAIDKNKALQLVAAGMITQQEAGKISGYSQNRISELLQDDKSNPEFRNFAEKKAETFEALQAVFINNIDAEKLKKTTAERSVWSIGVLQDKIMALRGQASEIVEYRALNVNATLQAIRERVQSNQVEDERQKTPENSPPPIELNNSIVSSE